MNVHPQINRFHRTRPLAVAALAVWACLALASPTRSYAVDQAAETASHTWAILIGVEKYHHATPLRYTLNDVVKLGETLQVYGGVPKSHFREMIDTAKDPRLQPLRSSISFWSRDQVATPVSMTLSSMGPMLSQISGQMALPGDPRASGCFVPSIGW